MPPHPITPQQRATHLSWLTHLTAIPTATGREHRVIRWIERWVAERPTLKLARDESGNLVITNTAKPAADKPIFFTAHLDHPGFVVERIVAPSILQLSFRGGVMDEYFKNADILIFDASDTAHRARLTGEADQTGPFKHYLAELAPGQSPSLNIGDVGVWDIGPAEVIDGILHTPACDDLAAAAAALAAFDILIADPDPKANASLLFTRAEEIGFVGAIGATRHNTMPKSARVIALENSRSFPDSPIGGGPIVRVGDRISIFSPTLTDAIAKRAEEIAGAPATPTASQKTTNPPQWKWQRKLMAGGACEASVFFNAGYESTCVCLPLGNYHNMADLTAVQAGTNTTPPRVAREFISVSDYEGLVDLLVACGQRLSSQGGLSDRFDKLWEERKFVLSET